MIFVAYYATAKFASVGIKYLYLVFLCLRPFVIVVYSFLNAVSNLKGLEKDTQED